MSNSLINDVTLSVRGRFTMLGSISILICFVLLITQTEGLIVCLDVYFELLVYRFYFDKKRLFLRAGSFTESSSCKPLANGSFNSLLELQQKTEVRHYQRTCFMIIYGFPRPNVKDMIIL